MLQLMNACVVAMCYDCMDTHCQVMWTKALPTLLLCYLLYLCFFTHTHTLRVKNPHCRKIHVHAQPPTQLLVLTRWLEGRYDPRQ